MQNKRQFPKAGKPLGPATAYMCGFIKGPVKIGVTARKPAKRLGDARRTIGRSGVQLFGSWYHPQAYLIEKFSHMYLRKYNLGGEWFSVTTAQGYRAVEKVLDMLDAPRGEIDEKGNWFERLGITEKNVKRCFGKEGYFVLKETSVPQSYRRRSDVLRIIAD